MPGLFLYILWSFYSDSAYCEAQRYALLITLVNIVKYFYVIFSIMRCFFWLELSFTWTCLTGGHTLQEDMSHWRTCLMGRNVFLEDISYRRKIFMGVYV